MVLFLAVFGTGLCVAAQIGADIPWTTFEAEAMRGNGTVIGPHYGPHRVEMESSGQKAVKLARPGDHREFDSDAEYDSVVLRYSLPDAETGGGTASTLELLVNGVRVRELALTSRNAWLYGTYPFSNDPRQGKPRNFYDELRVKGVKIARGDRVRLQKTSGDGVDCIIDLVDLELVPEPIGRPAGSLSVSDFGAEGRGEGDDTDALRRAIARAKEQDGGVVWIPAGVYKLTGDILVPSSVTIRGAGMWHTTFVGDPALYGHADRRVRFRLAGTDAHLADFSIVGELNYRNDQEPNDGIVGDGCRDASVSRVWIEHTKAGVWVYNGTRLTVEGCRFRNLIADGVNFCVGTSHAIVQNCAARGTGDDCYAIWPAVSDQGRDEHAEKPGHNVIRRSTGQLTFLANGAALYGGAGNRVEDCLFTDIGTGCGILISTTFPTTDERGMVDNNFSGHTVVKNNRLIRCGGYDHSWAWRGSVQLCLDRRSISGLRVGQLEIRDSISDGLTVVAPGQARGQGTLSDTILEDVVIANPGLGAPGRPGVWVSAEARGGLSLVRSEAGEILNESPEFRLER